MQIIGNRRGFLAGAAAAGLTGLPRWAFAEPPPEVTTIRLPAYPAACTAPLYLAEDLLHLEGFAEVRYVPTRGAARMLAEGELDVSTEDGFDYLPLVDAGKPLMILGGVHVGCFALIVNDSVQAIPDLRGKRVGVFAIGAPEHLLVSTVAAYVGLDPVKDIDWAVNASANQAELFKAGKIDAFIGFPPTADQPCARDVGRVLINMATDPPWSDYFCCMIAVNAGFARKNPVATKRAMRAILKAADLCHAQPKLAARRMVERGFSPECARMTLNDVRYGLWRDYDPEDSVRFFALRLHEVGMIKKTPNEIIAGFTDWRFLNELKRELKS